MEIYNVLKRPVSTEKAIKMMESENKLVFVVARKSKKAQIKKEFEEMFKAKVISVNTHILPSGEKRAFIKISQDKPAIDIATQLGLM